MVQALFEVQFRSDAPSTLPYPMWQPYPILPRRTSASVAVLSASLDHAVCQQLVGYPTVLVCIRSVVVVGASGGSG